MKIVIISFTKAGSAVCGRLVKGFREQGEECDGYVQPRFLGEGADEKTTDQSGQHVVAVPADLPWIHAVTESVGNWTCRMFGQVDALIYIGAAGIAVRAVGPYLKDKMTDPAVLVCDEQANFVISLLSGHVGGANALAARTADLTGAVPVITTASDVQGLMAVDVWAKERSLVLSDRKAAKRVAAALADGEPVGFYSDYQLAEPVPTGYVSGRFCRENVWVTCRTADESDLPEDSEVLRLIPKKLTVGIGCRKNIDFQKVELAVGQTFHKNNLDLRAVKQIASIDLKKEEAAVCRLAKELGVPFGTFSAEELETVTGELSESSFVRSVTGTGNVCERAALSAAGPGAQLLVRKEIYDGVTVAVAHELTETGARVK